MEPLSGTAVKNMIRRMHGKDFDQERATEIAQELEILADAVEQAPLKMNFNHEPSGFQAFIVSFEQES